MPYRAGTSRGRADRSIELGRVNGALHCEVNADADEAPRVGFGACGVKLDVERSQWLTAAREDQRHVRAHAAAERRAQQLHGRNPGGAVAIEDESMIARMHLEREVAGPAEREIGR